VIEAWLEADSRAPRKQKHTSKRIYGRLLEEHQFLGDLELAFTVAVIRLAYQLLQEKVRTRSFAS
jgi:hypothetical protein